MKSSRQEAPAWKKADVVVACALAAEMAVQHENSLDPPISDACQTLQIGNKEVLNCYYAHSEAQEALQVSTSATKSPLQGSQTEIFRKARGSSA